MSTLTAPTRDKLVKVLALTSSDNQGEVIAAAAAAKRIMQAHSLSWDDVVAPPLPVRQQAEYKTAASFPDHLQAVAECLRYGPPVITD